MNHADGIAPVHRVGPLLQGRRAAGGAARTARDLAAELGRDFDGVSKHLRLLREAGVLALRPGEARRHTHYFIPAEFRREAGVLDFGVCRVWVD